MEELFLGIDLGTTNCKCIVYDGRMEALGQWSGSYPIRHEGSGISEQEPDDWWGVMRSAVRGALSNAGRSGQQVSRLAVSSQGITFVPADSNGKPLRSAMTWLDNRAIAQAEALENVFSADAFYRITGVVPTAAYILPKLLWMRENEPQVWNAARLILTAHDYLVMRMTGKAATSDTLAAGTLLYDVREKGWSKELMVSFGLSPEMFPPICRAGTVVGTVTPDAANELGISENALVCVGGQDQKCAYFGAVLQNGDMTVSFGTAGTLSMRCNEVLYDDARLVSCAPFLTSEGWILEGVVGTAGACLKWLRETVFPNLTYEQIDEMAEKKYDCGGTDALFCPDFSAFAKTGGEYLARGAFAGLSLSTEPADLALAVLEGVVFRLCERIVLIEKMNRSASALRLFGGGADSRIWCRLVADITGREVSVCDTYDTACRGAAMLASGKCPSEHGGTARYLPDAARHARLREKHRLFLAAFGR